MPEAIHTRPFELAPSEYSATMVQLLRQRMVWFDIFAGILVVVVAKFVIRLQDPLSYFLFPFPIIIGFFRMPFRVRKMAESPNSKRPVGRVTFHVDEEGVLYSSPTAEPVILKWDELRSVRLIGGNYVIDGGFDEFLVHPSAFATAADERAFQSMTKARVKRTGGF
jgi:hypothetical protein